MAYAPYDILFSDQNPNREFIIQPETTNGPSSPSGGQDPNAAGANTTLYLYGQGSPNYGDRVWENLVYMTEHFFSVNEPSFPIPGQVWAKSSTNELTTPYQLQMYNPRQWKITASTTNQIYVVSNDGSLTPAQGLTRFQQLGLAKSFNVYDSSYNIRTFIQTAVPVISGAAVLLTVTPSITASLVGMYTGGWEEIYQGNAEVVLRRPFNAGTYNIVNLADPVNPQDAATKNYVDTAVSGGTLTLAGLADVYISGPTPGQLLSYGLNASYPSKWTNVSISSLGYLPLTGGTMQGTIDMGGYILTDLPLPTTPYDATSKLYVDGQPLSGANVLLTGTTAGDILVFNGTLWENQNSSNSGYVPISGGVTMTGALSFGNNTLTGLALPSNPTDAVNLGYLNSVIASGSGVVTGGSFNNSVGVLSLTLSGGFAPITIGGFLPTPNNQVPANEVAYTILPATSAKNQFFALEYGQTSPVLTTLDLALNQVDAALGTFTVPRQQLVFACPGTRTAFDINNLAFATPAVAPGRSYVKGSHNLAVYLNGIRQVASTAAVVKLSTTALIRDDYDINIAGGSCSITVNGGTAVTITLPGQTGTTLGALKNTINAAALAHFINPITSVTGLTFIVPGNVASAFPSGTTFIVQYSGTANDGVLFTVSGSGSTYNSTLNQTTITVTTVPTASTTGVIIQNNWGFSVSIENGGWVFHSNIPGALSSLIVSDGGLFSGITGITNPVSFNGAQVGNSLPPADYAYAEVGMTGYLSSLIVFNTPPAQYLAGPPASGDTMEILIDREMVYNSTNPFTGATIA